MNAEKHFTPRSLSASEYVLSLFEPADELAILTRNRRTGRTVQRIATAETITSPQFQSWLRSENAAGADIFVGMNPIKNGANSRTKENIREIRHLYLDLDRGGQAALEAIRNSTDVPAPNFILDTSPDKHQVVWRVEGLATEESEAMLRAMAVQFGGDPAATDSTRVLRLPGFANRKYDAEFIVQAHHESDAVHHARDFQLQEDSLETPRRFESEARSTLSPAHRSQSEQDWAYAKRALARGDDPAIVIQRIADFRAEEKPNPEYYARHTVNKAKEALRVASRHSSDALQTERKEVGREP
ncbi:MAG TPA: DNA-primase RepB domain-containing protein [Candidatus Acidoferrales bacterium]|nr:DNA-primase RepB domain-containing protein [Candidatus Acidoferrales bacterium]